jgi:acyl-CoA synthetase (AMP-forming)/AMP-acid ligase II
MPRMQIEGGPLETPSPPLGDLIRIAIADHPDATAIVSVADRMSWRELDDASGRLACAYRNLGLDEGDRVASLMPNRIALVIHYLACFRAGLVVTPLNYRYTHREIDHALGVSGASILVAHAERAEDLAASDLAGGLAHGIVSFEGDLDGASHAFEQLVESEPTAFDPPADDPADPAAIFFTSGSTGPSKGVTHTRGSLRWMIAGAAAAFELTADDVFLPGSSMSHIGSFLWALAALSVGGKVVVARTFDSHEILPLLRDNRPTVMAMIPAALIALVRDHDLEPGDFESLRVCRSGSDSVSTELLTEFAAAAGFPIDEGYGMSEVGLATLNPPSGEIRQGSIGRPIPGYEIAVRNEEDEHVASGEVGRVLIKTPALMSGYWEAADATAEVLKDGWIDSGDLARADDDGYLWFFGRKKQVIVHDGSNISPQEVEGSLVEHPAIELAGAVGVHDEVHGENVRAYVTLRDGADRPSAADLIAFSRERIGYKAPDEVVVMDEMPLNPTGKIDRAGLKKMATEHLHPHDQEGGTEPSDG